MGRISRVRAIAAARFLAFGGEHCRGGRDAATTHGGQPLGDAAAESATASATRGGGVRSGRRGRAARSPSRSAVAARRTVACREQHRRAPPRRAEPRVGLHLGAAGRLGGGRAISCRIDRLGLVHLVGPVARCAAASRARRAPRAVAARPGLQFLALPQSACCHSSSAARASWPEPAELLVDRRDGGVGFVERGQRLLGGVLPGGLLGQRAGQRRGQLATCASAGGQFAARPCRSSEVTSSVDSLRSEPPLTQPAPTRSPSTVTARSCGRRRHQVQRRGEVADHRDAGQHGDHRAAQFIDTKYYQCYKRTNHGCLIWFYHMQLEQFIMNSYLCKRVYYF